MKVVVVLAAALALSGVASSAPKDPALAKAVAYWHAQKCVPAPDETMWMQGWRFNALYGDCGGAIVRYRLVGRHVQRLDPAPRRQTGNVPLGLYLSCLGTLWTRLMGDRPPSELWGRRWL